VYALTNLQNEELTMTQQELDHHLARITGESLATIRSRGFSLVDNQIAATDSTEDDLGPQIYDWEAGESGRLHQLVEGCCAAS